jgi:hypothetical protein
VQNHIKKNIIAIAQRLGSSAESYQKNIIAIAQSLRSSAKSYQKNIIAIAQSLRSSAESYKKAHHYYCPMPQFIYNITSCEAYKENA